MRIRSIKPEWLSDEKLASLPDPERVLSVGLILIADDHGRGRANPAFIRSTVWPYADPPESLGNITERLRKVHEAGFIRLYRVGDQDYYEICNWLKHQRVSHPGAPTVPLPPEALGNVPESFVPEREIEKEIEKEGEGRAPTPTDYFPEADPLDPPPPPWRQVVTIWSNVGASLSGGPVAADMASHKPHAEALLRMVNGDLEKIKQAIERFWRAKLEKTGERPVMKWLVEDFDRYLNPPKGRPGPRPKKNLVEIEDNLAMAIGDWRFEDDQGNAKAAARYLSAAQGYCKELGREWEEELRSRGIAP